MELKIACGQESGKTTFCEVPIDKQGGFTEQIAKDHIKETGYYQYKIRYFDVSSKKIVETTILMNEQNFDVLNDALKKNETLARKSFPLNNKQKPDFVSVDTPTTFLDGLKEEAKKLEKLAEKPIEKSGYVGGGSVVARRQPAPVAVPVPVVTQNPESWIHSFDKPFELTFRVKNRSGRFVEKTIGLPKVPAMSLEVYREKVKEIGKNYVAVFAKTPARGIINGETFVFLLRRDPRNLSNDQMYQLNQEALKAGIIDSKNDNALPNLFTATDNNPASLDPLNPNPSEYYVHGTLNYEPKRNASYFQTRLQAPVVNLGDDTEELLKLVKRNVTIPTNKTPLVIQGVPILEREDYATLCHNPRRKGYLEKNYRVVEVDDLQKDGPNLLLLTPKQYDDFMTTRKAYSENLIPSFEQSLRSHAQTISLSSKVDGKKIIFEGVPTYRIDEYNKWTNPQWRAFITGKYKIVNDDKAGQIYLLTLDQYEKYTTQAKKTELSETINHLSKMAFTLRFNQGNPISFGNFYALTLEQYLAHRADIKGDYYAVYTQNKALEDKFDKDRKVVIFLFTPAEMESINRQARAQRVTSLFIHGDFSSPHYEGNKSPRAGLEYVSRGLLELPPRVPATSTSPTVSHRLRATIDGNGVLVGDLQILPST